MIQFNEGVLVIDCQLGWSQHDGDQNVCGVVGQSLCLVSCVEVASQGTVGTTATRLVVSVRLADIKQFVLVPALVGPNQIYATFIG